MAGKVDQIEDTVKGQRLLRSAELFSGRNDGLLVGELWAAPSTLDIV